MLQILIWGVCVLIFGVGACGATLERIAAGDKAKTFTGAGIFVLMTLLAVVIFILSIFQGQSLNNILGR
jgi:hypothetical protein